MEFRAALEIVKTLAQGINPITGIGFDAASHYNHPDIIRALFAVLERVPKIKKSPEEKQQDNAARGLPRNVGLPWTDEARQSVADSFRNGTGVDAIAATLERTKAAIVAELLRQQVINSDDATRFLGYSMFPREIAERSA